MNAAPKIALVAGLVGLLTAACAAPKATVTPPSSDARPRFEAREVDMACVQRAKEGNLVAALPERIGEFMVDVRPTIVTIARVGRPMTEEQGKALWQLFSTEYFPRGGLASGSNGLGSVYTCPRADKAGCFHLSLWACQTDLETLTGWMNDAAERVGAPGSEIDMEVSLLERAGPSCKESCAPSPHYSRKSDTYDPEGPRHRSAERGRGACASDADCVGADSNSCSAWYLRGGGEASIFIQVSEPTFCGCVEGECAWFTQ